ncbi:hypothetical protein SCQ05_04280 [Legionella pneumophila serogroup 1]|nr:hypothetical protein [Legionella pneumophila]HAU1316074.1 hypothetical protein [Legionella pneumophila]HBI5778508.1 hypothetical protein [Legionella pneumophila]HBJ7666213.1 hypothetical protein [Legionella pneumophila]HDU8068257.1 hypothetical protein [Legionella pneumophila]
MNNKEIKQIHIKLDPKLHQALKLEAVSMSLTIQDLVINLIEQHIKQGTYSHLIKKENTNENQ